MFQQGQNNKVDQFFTSKLKLQRNALTTIGGEGGSCSFSNGAPVFLFGGKKYGEYIGITVHL